MQKSWSVISNMAKLMEATTDHNPDVRRHAATVLGNMGYEAIQAIPELVILLMDPSKEIRQIANDSLEKIAPEWRTISLAKACLPNLVKSLIHVNAEVQELALATLNNISLDWAFWPETQRIIHHLITLLIQSDGTKRFSIVWALGKMESAVAVAIPNLVEILTSQDKTLRLYAIWILGNIRKQEAVTGLMPLLMDTDDEINEAVLEALIQITPKWTSTREAQLYIPELIKILMTQPSTIYKKAEYILIQMANQAQSTIPVLVMLFLDPSKLVAQIITPQQNRAELSGGIQITIAKILEKINPQWEAGAEEYGPAIPALIKLVVYPIPLVSSYSQRLLGRIHPSWYNVPSVKLVISYLINKLETGSEVSRLTIVTTFGKMTNYVQELIPPLMMALIDELFEIRRKTLDTLARLNPQWATTPEAQNTLPQIIKILKEAPSPARCHAAHVLELMGPAAEKAVPALIWALKSVDAVFISFIVEALGAIGPVAKKAMNALIITPNSIALDTEKRKIIYATLTKLDPDWARTPDAIATIPNLLQALQNTQDEIRLWAIETLELIGNTALTGNTAKDTIKALSYSLLDKYGTIRMKSASILAKAEPSAYTDTSLWVEAVPNLISALNDKDEGVCFWSVVVLGQIGPLAEPAILNLIMLLAHRTKDISLAANDALQKINRNWRHTSAADSAVSLLIPYLNFRSTHLDKKDWCFQEGAAYTLGLIGPKAKQAIPDLILCLIDICASVRRNAGEALDKINPEWHQSTEIQKIVPELITILFSSNIERRLDAMRIVKKIKIASEDILSALICPLTTLTDENIDSCKISVETLNQLQPQWAMMPSHEHIVVSLVKNLVNPNINIRQAASTMLNTIVPHWINIPGISQAVPEIIGALAQDNLVEVAIKTLGFMATMGKQAMPHLIQISLRHRMSKTRKYAVWALKKMGSDVIQSAFKAFASALSDTDMNVCRAAKEALEQL